jgi:hypothetical protein
LANGLLCRWVDDLDGVAALRVNPGPIDVQLPIVSHGIRLESHLASGKRVLRHSPNLMTFALNPLNGEMQDVESRCLQIALHRLFNTQPGEESVGVEFEQDLSAAI